MLFTSFIQILLSTTSPTQSSIVEIYKRITRKTFAKASPVKKIKNAFLDKKEQRQSTFSRKLQN